MRIIWIAAEGTDALTSFLNRVSPFDFFLWRDHDFDTIKFISECLPQIFFEGLQVCLE